jgi:hypothetical protein
MLDRLTVANVTNDARDRREVSAGAEDQNGLGPNRDERPMNRSEAGQGTATRAWKYPAN